MLSKRAANPIKRNRIGARVKITQTESENSEIMPEIVVDVVRARIEVKEEHEGVIWQQADGENEDEYQYGYRHLFPGTNLRQRYIIHKEGTRDEFYVCFKNEKSRCFTTFNSMRK